MKNNSLFVMKMSTSIGEIDNEYKCSHHIKSLVKYIFITTPSKTQYMYTHFVFKLEYIVFTISIKTNQYKSHTPSTPD